MALNKQEVIIEFNAETNEAERSVNSLTDSYSDLEKKIDAVADAQQRQAAIGSKQGSDLSKVTKAVDKITQAETKRANVEKAASPKRLDGAKKYLTNLQNIVGGVNQATQGQSNFLSSGLAGFRAITGGIKQANLGFKAMKGAIASTGIGLLVVAAGTLYEYWDDIVGLFSDDSAEKQLQATANEAKRLAEESAKEVQYLEAQGASQYEVNKAKKESLQATLDQAEAELDLAREQEDQEAILQAQNTIKQANLDITLQELEAERERRDILEELRRQADEDYREQQEDQEATEDFYAALADTQERLAKAQQELDVSMNNMFYPDDETLRKQIDDYTDYFLTGFRGDEKLVPDQIVWYAEQAGELSDVLERRVELREEIEKLVTAEAELEEIIRLTEEQRAKAKDDETKKDRQRDRDRRDRLEAEAQRERELQYALADELYKLTLEARDQEELAAQQLYDKRIAIAGDDEGLIKAATEQLQRDLQQIDFKYEELRQKEMLKGEDEDLDPRIVMLEKYYAAAQTLLQQDLQYTKDEELASIQERYATQLALADQLGLDKAVLLEAQRKEEYDINEKWDKLDEDRQRMKNQMRMDMAVQGAQAIQALGKAFASQDEADAERSFKVQKGLSIASATVSAVEGVINAFTTAQGSPYTKINPAYPFIQAGLAAAFGTAQVATIARQQYSPSATPDDINPGPGAGGGQGLAPPTIDLSFLGEGAGQAEPIRAYVLAENVSNAQQANQKILDQAALRN